MEAFPWAPCSPRRGRVPAPVAVVPSVRYVSAQGQAHRQQFSSWNYYLGLAMLITKAVDGELRFWLRPWQGWRWQLSALFVVLLLLLPPHGGGPGAGASLLRRGRRPQRRAGIWGCFLGGTQELRAGPAENGLLEEPFAELSPFAGRAAAFLLGCVHAATPEVTPREERAPAWAAEPRLQATSGIATARLLKPELQVCVFCRNNKEEVALYTTHILKGPDGRVLCPILRRYTCPLCGASGDNAHTIKYRPRGARDSLPGRKLR